MCAPMPCTVLMDSMNVVSISACVAAPRFLQLFYSKLPGDITSKTVILVDPMLATGGSAIQAIQVRSPSWHERWGL